MAYENSVNTGLECKNVGLWRAGGVYKHYIKMWIAIDVSISIELVLRNIVKGLCL